jgi:hypothetical protein
MKNKGVADTAFADAVHYNLTPSNANKLILEYENHLAYVLFISSLRDAFSESFTSSASSSSRLRHLH